MGGGDTIDEDEDADDDAAIDGVVLEDENTIDGDAKCGSGDVTCGVEWDGTG